MSNGYTVIWDGPNGARGKNRHEITSGSRLTARGNLGVIAGLKGKRGCHPIGAAAHPERWAPEKAVSVDVV